MRSPIVLLLSFAALSCSSKADEQKTEQGTLAKVTFAYLCVEESALDPYCDALVPNPKFPALAAGGTFYVGARSADGKTPVAVESTAPSRIAVIAQPMKTGPDSFSFQKGNAQAPGVTSLLAGKDDTQFADYVDVIVARATRLGIKQITIGDKGKVTGTLGPVTGTITFDTRMTYLRAAPIDDGGTELGGARSEGFAWTTSNESVVKIVSGANDHIAQIELGTAGDATLTVTSGALSAATVVTVKP